MGYSAAVGRGLRITGLTEKLCELPTWLLFIVDARHLCCGSADRFKRVVQLAGRKNLDRHPAKHRRLLRIPRTRLAGALVSAGEDDGSRQELQIESGFDQPRGQQIEQFGVARRISVM